MDVATTLKQEIYRRTAAEGEVPSLDSLAGGLEKSRDEINAACLALQESRLLVLDEISGEIRMAPPFSGVASPHRVKVKDKTYYANCIWDAFGVAAAFGSDADIATGCADCGDPMSLKVRNGAPLPEPCVIHYAVPAAHWWDDIVFT